MILPEKRLTVLHIEDSTFDRMILQRGFKLTNPPVDLKQATHGEEALHMLRGECGEEQLTLPLLILVDLNMPRMNGVEFLRQLQKEAIGKHAIIYALSTSARRFDIEQCYEFGASGYISKDKLGTDCEPLMRLITAIDDLVTLPGDPSL